MPLRKRKDHIDIADLKLGRLPATRPYGLETLSVYANGKLPKPPASVGAPTGITWGMDDNDKLGCCTISGADHLLAAWNADYGHNAKRPTDSEISNTYFSLTGGVDSGLNEAFVLKTWQTTGLFGNKIAAYAPTTVGNLIELHQAIAFYGGAYLGIECPVSAQEQFQNGQPWTYVPGSQIAGGHCIVALGFSSTSVVCCSWGALVEVTYPFLAHYLEESWCIISSELVEKGSDNFNLNLVELQADLKSI